VTRVASLWFSAPASVDETAIAVERSLSITLRSTSIHHDIRARDEGDEHLAVYEMAPHMYGYSRFPNAGTVVRVWCTARPDQIVDAMTGLGLELLLRRDWNADLAPGEYLVLRGRRCPSCGSPASLLVAFVDLDSGDLFLMCDEVDECWWGDEPTRAREFSHVEVFERRVAGWDDLERAGSDPERFQVVNPDVQIDW